MIASDTQPLQNIRVLLKIGNDFGKQFRKEWGHYWVHTNFEAIEQFLKENAGIYSIGDQVSMADCCLIPIINNAKRYNVDMNQFPIIARIEKSCTLMEEFERSRPENQPDYTNNTRL
jgi:maleylpyruvate isomerase